MSRKDKLYLSWLLCVVLFATNLWTWVEYDWWWFMLIWFLILPLQIYAHRFVMRQERHHE